MWGGGTAYPRQSAQRTGAGLPRTARTSCTRCPMVCRGATRDRYRTTCDRAAKKGAGRVGAACTACSPPRGPPLQTQAGTEQTGASCGTGARPHTSLPVAATAEGSAPARSSFRPRSMRKLRAGTCVGWAGAHARRGVRAHACRGAAAGFHGYAAEGGRGAPRAPHHVQAVGRQRGPQLLHDWQTGQHRGRVDEQARQVGSAQAQRGAAAAGSKVCRQRRAGCASPRTRDALPAGT